MRKSTVYAFASVLILFCLIRRGVSLNCDSCGKECVQICGTKRFRNCCYNYIKKRSGAVATGSGLRVELMMQTVPGSLEYYPSLGKVIAGYEEERRLKIDSEDQVK